MNRAVKAMTRTFGVVIDPGEAVVATATSGASYKYVTYVSSDMSLHPLKI